MDKEIKGFIYNADGKVCEVKPANGKDFKLSELQKIVGGYIEIANMNDGRIMVLNEEGKCNNLPINKKATELYKKFVYGNDFICGNVLICNSNLVR